VYILLVSFATYITRGTYGYASWMSNSVIMLT